MTSHAYEDNGAALSRVETETEIQRADVRAVAILNKSEVEAQLDAAHKYRRSVGSFLREAATLATISRQVAESCIYAIPRDGKLVAGPSVRLAEICASAYGNLHIGARIVDVEEKEVVAQGIAWDLEKNLRATVETRRRITTKSGRRYSDDMVTVTGNAAASIALRNAIFRVIPRAYVDTIYAKARDVSVGDAKTLAARRQEVLARLTKIGVPPDRVFAKLGKAAIEDIGLEDLETLIGLGTAIKNGDMQIDEAFPPVVAAVPAAPASPQDDGRRISMRGKGVKEQIASAPADPASQPKQTDATPADYDGPPADYRSDDAQPGATDGARPNFE